MEIKPATIQDTNFAQKFAEMLSREKEKELKQMKRLYIYKPLIIEMENMQSDDQVSRWQVIWFVMRNTLTVVKLLYYICKLIELTLKIFRSEQNDDN